MNTPKSRIDVVAAVIKREDRYLICQRPPKKRHGGLWEFPGGKVDSGETFSDALSRELQEELSLSIESIGDVLFDDRESRSPFHIHFVIVRTEGIPVLHEHDHLKWGTVSEILALPLAPTDRKFAERLE